MNEVLFYDVDCLNSFFLTKQTFILRKLFKKIIIPQQVYDQFKKADNIAYIQMIKQFVDEDFIDIVDIDVLSKEHMTYKSFLNGSYKCKCAGKVEAIALALAIHKHMVLATNDIDDINETITEYKIQHICTADIINEAVLNNIITLADAESIWLSIKSLGCNLKTCTYSQYRDLICAD